MKLGEWELQLLNLLPPLSVCPSVCMNLSIVCVQVLSTTFLGPHLDETCSNMSDQLLNQLDNFDK